MYMRKLTAEKRAERLKDREAQREKLILRRGKLEAKIAAVEQEISELGKADQVA
jgi:hypothetical protein